MDEAARVLVCPTARTYIQLHDVVCDQIRAMLYYIRNWPISRDMFLRGWSTDSASLYVSYLLGKE